MGLAKNSRDGERAGVKVFFCKKNFLRYVKISRISQNLFLVRGRLGHNISQEIFKNTELLSKYRSTVLVKFYMFRLFRCTYYLWLGPSCRRSRTCGAWWTAAASSGRTHRQLGTGRPGFPTHPRSRNRTKVGPGKQNFLKKRKVLRN